MNPPELLHQLTACARDAARPETLALAGTIALSPTRKGPYRAPIRGLAADELPELLAEVFPRAAPLLPLLQARTIEAAADNDVREDEFHDLVGLLLEHESLPGAESRWLACAVATASMAENHLWQDLGLPNRGALNALMETRFTALKLKNAGDMKWKKFFYRQLCERAEVLICKSPTCGECADFAVCFGPETD